jgi:DNA-binding SARP family transcriptional activator
MQEDRIGHRDPLAPAAASPDRWRRDVGDGHGGSVPRWSLRLLGPFALERDGQPLTGFRSDKVRALLAYLASEPNRAWSRSALADLLWPDRSEPVARANLRNALSNLRRVLDDTHATPPFLELAPTEIRTNATTGHWTDVAALHHLLEPGTGEPLDADDPRTINRLEQAFELIRGDFLEGLSLDSGPFAAWAGTMRERWRGATLRTARTLARAYARRGDPAAAEAATRRWLAIEPWDESAHRHLMRLLARQGQRAAALAQHDTCRRILADELGLEPEEETTRLATAIQTRDLSGDPAATIDTWPGLAELPTTTDTPLFVARTPELTALDTALQRTDTDGAGTVFIIGEAGSGKTALLTEFARRAQDRDPNLLTLWGHGSSFTGQGDPFEPFVHVARMLCGEAEAPPHARGAHRAEQARRTWRRLPDTIEALLDHAPDLLGRFVATPTLRRFAHRHPGVTEEHLTRLDALAGRAPRPPTGRAPVPTTLFEQFTAVLRHLTRHQRMLVLLDDLQWIDPGSVELLFHLARGLGTARVLLAGAYRTEQVVSDDGAPRRPLAAAVSELLSMRQAELVDLADAADAAFVEAVLDSEPNALGPAFRARLTAHTGGHALFTIELLRGMQVRGDLRRDQGGRWVEAPGLRWDELPGRVEATIASRIGHLSAACVEALEVASVEGEEFTAEVVAAVTGRPLPETCDLLSREAGRRQRLVMAHVVRPVADGGLGIYRFRHGLFPSYLHRRLDEVERARLHGQVARELERLYRHDMHHYPQVHHLLARHYDAAGMGREAVAQYAAAAAHARRLSAHASCVAHLQRALELLSDLPASPERDAQELRLHLALGTTVTAAQGWAPPELEAVYARARDLAERVDDVVQVLAALWQLQLFHLGRAEHDLSDRAHERLRALSAHIEDPVVRDQMRMTVLPYFRGRFVEARRVFETVASDGDVTRQRALAERFGLASAPVARAYLAECLWLLGESGGADRYEAEARELACAVGHPMTTGTVFARACWRAAFSGDHAATGARAADLLRIVREHDLGNYLLTGTFFREFAALEAPASGRLERLEDAIERYRLSGTLLGRSAFLTLFARACAQEGQPERGLAAVDAALAAAAHSGERWIDAETWRAKAALLWMRGSRSDDAGRSARAARACLVTAVRIARAQGALALVRLAEADGIRSS